MYVVEVWRVVDGFEKALDLAGRSTVDNQDEGDPHRLWRVALGRVLVPLDVGVGFTCKAGRGHVCYCWVAVQPHVHADIIGGCLRLWLANQIRFAAISHDMMASSRPQATHGNDNHNHNKKDGNKRSLLMKI